MLESFFNSHKFIELSLFLSLTVTLNKALIAKRKNFPLPATSYCFKDKANITIYPLLSFGWKPFYELRCQYGGSTWQWFFLNCLYTCLVFFPISKNLKIIIDIVIEHLYFIQAYFNIILNFTCKALKYT